MPLEALSAKARLRCRGAPTTGGCCAGRACGCVLFDGLGQARGKGAPLQVLLHVKQRGRRARVPAPPKRYRLRRAWSRQFRRPFGARPRCRSQTQHGQRIAQARKAYADAPAWTVPLLRGQQPGVPSSTLSKAHLHGHGVHKALYQKSGVALKGWLTKLGR